jgi:uncharacterized protein VirK/YbjX
LRCIRDDERAGNHPFFGVGKGDRVKLRYDELWMDQGGQLDTDGFYAMPARVEDRPLADVPAKKRGRYKRRLEMYADIQTRMAQALVGIRAKRAD